MVFGCSFSGDSRFLFCLGVLGLALSLFLRVYLIMLPTFQTTFALPELAPFRAFPHPAWRLQILRIFFTWRDPRVERRKIKPFAEPENKKGTRKEVTTRLTTNKRKKPTKQWKQNKNQLTNINTNKPNKNPLKKTTHRPTHSIPSVFAAPLGSWDRSSPRRPRRVGARRR